MHVDTSLKSLGGNKINGSGIKTKEMIGSIFNINDFHFNHLSIRSIPSDFSADAALLTAASGGSRLSLEHTIEQL